VTRRKHPRWNGDPAQCAYCLGPNDRATHRNRNSLPPTRCSACAGITPPADVLSPAERQRIADMLSRPTWRPAT
jgi:hypothetical protein